MMPEIETLLFHDVDSHQECCVIIRASNTAIGLCVSLEKDGDVQAFLTKKDGEKLLAALAKAVSFGGDKN